MCDRKMRVNEYKGDLFTLLSASILFKVPKNLAVVYNGNIKEKPAPLKDTT